MKTNITITNEQIANDVLFVKDCMLHTLKTHFVEESIDEVLFQGFFQMLACGNDTKEEILETLESHYRQSFLIAFTSYLVIYDTEYECTIDYTLEHERSERLYYVYMLYSRNLKEIL